jgi:hypothetical protein
LNDVVEVRPELLMALRCRKDRSGGHPGNSISFI